MEPALPHLNIELCLGSSCYCRGNDKVSAGLQEVITRRGWTGRVTVKGCLCKEACSKGPLVFINGAAHEVRGTADLETLLAQKLDAVAPSGSGG